MSDIGDWFRSIPFITRYWFAASIAVPLFGKLGLINHAYLVLWPEAFLHRFQIWRPITSTFYFPVGPGTGFLYMVNLYFLYQYSTRLETGTFDGRPADYLFMLLFNWICIVITGLIMDMQLLMIPLIMSVLYVWSQLNRDMIVSFWFGTRFKACYLPWVILGFNYIIGGSIINELIGNLVGHLYFFLMFKYPMDLGGRSFLSTPQFLVANGEKNLTYLNWDLEENRTSAPMGYDFNLLSLRLLCWSSPKLLQTPHIADLQRQKKKSAPEIRKRYRWLPSRRGGVSGFGVPPPSARRAAEEQVVPGRRHNWGQGFRLGEQ